MLLNDISPKLMLKVDLIDDDKVDFELVLFDKNRINLNKEYIDAFKSFSTNNSKFLIYLSEVFDFEINTSSNIIRFPLNFVSNTRQKHHIKLKNDLSRYNYLKEIKDALIEWSGSIMWNANKCVPKISYNGKIWILF